MQEELVKEVKKMNSFLEAIDWKLWEIYKKMNGETTTTHATPTTAPVSESVVAPVVTPTQVVTPVVPIPSYPNIEKWK